jgi:subtilisin family serine protease
MKMDFRACARLSAILFFSALTAACGQQRTASGSFEKASEECFGEAIPKQFMVRFKDGRIEKVNAPSKEEFINGYLTENLDQIEYAEHDYYVRISTPVKQKVAQSMWADNWGAERVGAQFLWQQGVKGSGVTVAVIDTGMDLTHPQLKNRILANPGEQGVDISGRDKATNGVDDDGNGFADDALGYDFARSRSLRGDYTYHGSHVSGIIAGEHADTNAGGAPYVQGVAPGAKILPLAFLDETGSGAMTDAVRAIHYAVQRGVKVINASWGGPGCSRSLQEAVTGLESKGIVFVAAAGNESSNIDRNKTFPGSLDLPAQITVGAIGYYGNMSQYSNYGLRTVHIFAPGDGIISTVPGGLAALDGTSMAAPFVAGAVALLMSAEPSATPAQIRQAFYNTAFVNSDYLNASQGALNLSSALAELRRLMAR